MKINSELLKKYNVPGPRYTSYPTVPYWEASPTQEQWIESVSHALEESDQQGIGTAVYVHIPFCETLCTYCGCNTRISRDHKVGAPYVDLLLKEWELYLKNLNREITLSEIHLGGGTPTFLSPEELQKLMQGIVSRVRVASDAEFSIEADPRVTRKEHLTRLADLGFKRLSLGIQDFDEKVQKTVHRVQSVEQVYRTTEEARQCGFNSINYDLIYGLPFQTLESVTQTVNAVRDLRPDRIAYFGYAHVPWIKPGQRRFTEADLPSGNEKRALYELGREMLEAVGYLEVGMDHFALTSDPLWKSTQEKNLHRNFMGYTTRQVSPLIGLGVSAIGDAWGAFAQNEKLLETYRARVENGELPIFRGHLLTDEDKVLRRHILNLMTRFETEWSLMAGHTSHLDSVSTSLNEFQRDGLVQLREKACVVTQEGRPFLRNICMAFDARLIRRAPTTKLFSQTI